MKLGILSDRTGTFFEEVIDFASENVLNVWNLHVGRRGKATRRYAGVTHIDMVSLDDKVSYIRQYASKKALRSVQ